MVEIVHPHHPRYSLVHITQFSPLGEGLGLFRVWTHQPRYWLTAAPTNIAPTNTSTAIMTYIQTALALIILLG